MTPVADKLIGGWLGPNKPNKPDCADTTWQHGSDPALRIHYGPNKS